MTKRPIWIYVQSGNLEELDVRASARFWPEHLKSVALFLIEFEETPPQEVLATFNIGISAVGPYVYLNPPGPAGEIQQTLLFPKARIKRVGFRLWNSQDPVVLENVELDAHGAKLESDYEFKPNVFLNNFPDFKNQTRPEMLAVNLMIDSPGCTAHCHAICRNWYETMDHVAQRYRTEDVGRVNCFFNADNNVQVPVTVFNGTPAVLNIPESHEKYLEQVGVKARNMIRKAQRQGYHYVKADPDQHLDEVLAIRTSDPERQGKPIPEYYRVRPTRMIEQPFSEGCGRHGEEFFGLFKDGVLVAYITIFLYGELGQVNHILGHADHLNEGVMNLLVSEMVREIIAIKPWIRGINFLYPHASQTNTGVGLFKRTVGFMPERLVVTDAKFDLKPYFTPPSDRETVQPVVQPSEKKNLKAITNKAVKQAETSVDLVFPDKAIGRAAAVDQTLNILDAFDSSLNLHRVREWTEIEEGDFNMEGSHVLLFEKIRFGDYQDFLSTGLKSFRKIVPKDTFLLFDFKTSLSREYVLKERDMKDFLRTLLSRKGRRINQELIEYFLKRFKTTDLALENIKTGFKGSDYIVAGLISYGESSSYEDFDGLLVLRKIR